MLIEYFGISGVGKTTKAKEMYIAARKEGKKVRWPRQDRYMKHSWLVRNIKKAFVFFKFVITRKKWVKNVKSIFNTLSLKKKDKRILLFNYISFKNMYDHSRNEDYMYFFDEGVFQLIWALYLRCCDEPRYSVVTRIFELFPAPDSLYIVTASNDIIERRLISRGTKTRILREDNVSATIERMKIVMDTILDFAERAGYIGKTTIVTVNNDI